MTGFTYAEDEMNDCQRAFEMLAARPDAEAIGSHTGPHIEIRRKIAAPGEMSDGTRVFIVKPCERWRWMTVILGWDTLAEIDQRQYFRDPNRLVRDVLAVIDGAATSQLFREELTPSGPQLVIPGCERRLPDTGKPTQLTLF